MFKYFNARLPQSFSPLKPHFPTIDCKYTFIFECNTHISKAFALVKEFSEFTYVASTTRSIYTYPFASGMCLKPPLKVVCAVG